MPGARGNASPPLCVSQMSWATPPTRRQLGMDISMIFWKLFYMEVAKLYTRKMPRKQTDPVGKGLLYTETRKRRNSPSNTVSPETEARKCVTEGKDIPQDDRFEIRIIDSVKEKELKGEVSRFLPLASGTCIYTNSLVNRGGSFFSHRKGEICSPCSKARTASTERTPLQAARYRLMSLKEREREAGSAVSRVARKSCKRALHEEVEATVRKKR
ncbi:uncharacterized protein [Ptychodera flava]|uniref:uncharacterized protein n=1 Tax=Ptychodera flava TaxID=63121 RepID=UPI00396A883F